jgi:hypothetical protein
MTSLTRKMRRKRLGAVQFKKLFPRPEARHEPLPDGGYIAYHPTRGPRRFSYRRLQAQFLMANILGV